ncbi:MAG: hypothetical protein EHM45_17995 [Desulfobacteraceae bacterium]|nr:MAG: hypothetical protein EHM45_17995 [Desulfobacteraceae bacterium]
MNLWPFKKPDCVAIIIHGLQNKPPGRLFKRWCLEAIREGFTRAGLVSRLFTFEFVYWSHHLYPNPLNPLETREGHPCFLAEPYVPCEETLSAIKKNTRISIIFRSLAQKTLAKLFLGSSIQEKADALAGNILEYTFPDLALYYANKRVFDRKKGVRDLLRAELLGAIRKYPESKILLIAHSMGSIVAYDILADSSLSIDILLTVGSPLGSPVVRKRFAQEYDLPLTNKDKIPAPESVQTAWYNLADIEDMVAFDAKLADHYAPNSRAIAPQDVQTVNDYVFQGNANHHNIFGYLRSTELVRILHSFIDQQPFSVRERIANKFASYLTKIKARQRPKL